MDERLKALLFPRSLCLGCDEPREIDVGAPLCDRCREELEALRLTDGICPRCLSPKGSSDPCRFCGDGKINYQREGIFETYYSMKVNTFLWATADFQRISHPCYNADRGPVNVYSVRLHIEF